MHINIFITMFLYRASYVHIYIFITMPLYSASEVHICSIYVHINFSETLRKINWINKYLGYRMK